MAHDPWIDYGTGIFVDRIKTTPEKILNLVNLVPDFAKDFEEKAGDSIENLKANKGFSFKDINDIMGEFGMPESCGSILAIVIKECEKVRFKCIDGSNDDTYLIFPDRAAWNYNSKERNTSENDVKNMLSKYLKYLTNQPLDDLGYGRQEVIHEG